MERRVIDLTDAPLWPFLLGGAALGALIGFASTLPIWLDWLVK